MWVSCKTEAWGYSTVYQSVRLRSEDAWNKPMGWGTAWLCVCAQLPASKEPSVLNVESGRKGLSSISFPKPRGQQTWSTIMFPCYHAWSFCQRTWAICFIIWPILVFSKTSTHVLRKELYLWTDTDTKK